MYEQRGEAFGCHRADRDAARVLGSRATILSTRAAGRYAAVERRGAGAPGERLTVYDLRRRRRTADVRLDRGNDRGGSFTRIRLDRAGIAAYVADLPAGPAGPARVRVSTTFTDDYLGDTFAAEGPDIARHTLGFAGGTLAWRRGPYLELADLGPDVAVLGPLLRLGELRIDAGDRGLVLRPPGRRAIRIGGAHGVCQSSSGCGGINALQRAGRFVGVRWSDSDASYTDDTLRLADLEAGTLRMVYDPLALPYAGLYSFVVLESGATAFVVSEAVRNDPTVQQQAITRVRTSSGEILDEGEGIDRDSLRLRGDRLVWRHDGKRRTAPLPR